MTRSAADAARSAAGYPLRRVPGAGGVAAGIATAVLLSRWAPEEVATALSTAGIAVVPDQMVLAATGGAVVGVVAWAILYLVWGRGGWRDRPWRGRQPQRKPLSYADLGPPPPREQPLPSDLDQPLSAFDPEAIAFHQRRLR